MGRRLFEDLVVPPGTGGGTRRAGLLPVSLVIHAVVLGVILVVPVLTPGELPPVGTTPDILMVPGVLVPPPPPRRGVSPSDIVRRPSRRVEPAPSISGSFISLPISWSELPSDQDPGWGLGDLPVCEGCVPWGVDDGVPGLEPSTPPVVPPAPVVRSGGIIEPPLRVRHQVPEYPDLARAAGVEGMVIVECRVDTEGNIVDARVLRGHPLLDAAALEAIRQWRYRPTLLNGQRVSVLMTVTVRFQLRSQ